MSGKPSWNAPSRNARPKRSILGGAKTPKGWTDKGAGDGPRAFDPLKGEALAPDPVAIAERVVFKLWADGAVSARAIEQARREAEGGVRLDQALTRRRLVDPAAAAAALSDELGAPLADETDFPSEPVLGDALPARFVREALALPLADDGEVLRLAVADPLDDYAMRAIAMKTRRRLAPMIATAETLDRHADRLYREAPARLEPAPQRRALPPPSDYVRPSPRREADRADAGPTRAPFAKPKSRVRAPHAAPTPERAPLRTDLEIGRAMPPAAEPKRAAALTPARAAPSAASDASASKPALPRFVRPKRVMIKDSSDVVRARRAELEDKAMARRPRGGDSFSAIDETAARRPRRRLEAPRAERPEPGRAPSDARRAEIHASEIHASENRAPERREDTRRATAAERTERAAQRPDRAPSALPTLPLERLSGVAPQAPDADAPRAAAPERPAEPPRGRPGVADGAFQDIPRPSDGSVEAVRALADAIGDRMGASERALARSTDTDASDPLLTDPRLDGPDPVAPEPPAPARPAELERASIEPTPLEPTTLDPLTLDPLPPEADQRAPSAPRRAPPAAMIEDDAPLRLDELRRRTQAGGLTASPGESRARRRLLERVRRAVRGVADDRFDAATHEPVGSLVKHRLIDPAADDAAPVRARVEPEPARAGVYARADVGAPDREDDDAAPAAPMRVAAAETAAVRSDLNALAPDAEVRDVIEKALMAADGLMVICGPSGAGKMQTVRTLAARMLGDQKPIPRFDAPEAPQTGQSRAGLLIGEIRDAASAEAAARAAMKGALVLASIDAPTVAAAPPRLTALGLPPYALASGLRAVLSQELRPQACGRCAGTGRSASSPNESCSECGGAGRIAAPELVEALILDDAVRALILNRAPEAAFRHASFSASAAPAEIEDETARPPLPRPSEHGRAGRDGEEGLISLDGWAEQLSEEQTRH